MAKLRADENGSGPNRQAVEDVVASIEERYGMVMVYDRPLIQRARSLASAVDDDPANSQLQIQFGSALTQLRREVMSAEKDRYESLIWSLRIGCELHDRGEVHCAACCMESPSISEVQSWEPPWRAPLADDEEFARTSVIEYLGARHRVRYGE